MTGTSSPGRSTATTISFTEVSIPRWISSAADGTLVMTVGSLLPVAPSAAWLQHLRPASDDPRHKPSGYLTDRTGVGRFMLTYLPQGPAPVTGRLSGGWYLSPSGDWDSGNATFAISRGSPGAPPLTPGHGHRFPGMLFSSGGLSAPSKPSDPGITPLIPARCAGDTTV